MSNYTIKPDLSSKWWDDNLTRMVLLPPYNTYTGAPFQSEEDVVNFFKNEVETVDMFWRDYKSDEALELERLGFSKATVRDRRNALLAESDWTQLADSPLDADAKLAWALYRETLRMIPQQDGFPETVNWPPKP